MVCRDFILPKPVSYVFLCSFQFAQVFERAYTARPARARSGRSAAPARGQESARRSQSPPAGAQARPRRPCARCAGVLEVCVLRNGAQPRLKLAVAAKRIKMGVGAVKGLRRELFGDGRISAQGAQVTEHERTVGCKYDVERVHPCPSHLDALSIRVHCVQKVTADLHFSSAVSEIPRQGHCITAARKTGQI